MSTGAKVAGAWKDVTAVSVKTGGAWKNVEQTYVRVAGLWKEVFSAKAPVVTGFATYDGGNVATHSIALPAGIVAGERLLMLIAATGSTTPSSIPAGWEQVASVAIGAPGGLSGQDRRLIVLTLPSATGAEGGSLSVSFSQNGTGNARTIGAVTYRIADATSLEVSAGATGSSATPSPDALTPTWGASSNTLWIAAAAVRGNAPTGYPTGFANSYSDGQSGVFAAAATMLSRAASLTPSPFTLPVADNWAAMTLGIRA